MPAAGLANSESFVYKGMHLLLLSRLRTAIVNCIPFSRFIAAQALAAHHHRFTGCLPLVIATSTFRENKLAPILCDGPSCFLACTYELVICHSHELAALSALSSISARLEIHSFERHFTTSETSGCPRDLFRSTSRTITGLGRSSCGLRLDLLTFLQHQT